MGGLPFPIFIEQGQKNDPPAGIGAGQVLQTNGGLFATPGLERPVFSAMMRPMMGLFDAIPVMPAGTSIFSDSEYGGVDAPLYDTITGITRGNLDAWDYQPDAPCDDAPISGVMKACALTQPYGRQYGAIQFRFNELGRIRNRGVETDLELVNRAPVTGLLPDMTRNVDNSALRNIVSARLFESGVAFERMIAPLMWTGTPANNKAGGGAKQYQGLEILVNTGNKYDAINGTPCSALDSDVKNFQCQIVSQSGNDIVSTLDAMYHYLAWNASQSGLNPVRWALVMRPELFDEITKIWPIRYYQELIAALGSGNNGRLNFDANRGIEARDDYRRNSYLPIRGERVTVILDDTLPERNVTNQAGLSAGQYCSDIYFMPFTVLGGIPVLYWEVFNQDNAMMRAAEAMLRGEYTFTTDGGRFRFHVNYRNGCVSIQYEVEYRLILRTPQLAGRLLNVGYQPLQKTRSWDPTSTYFHDGGRSNTPLGSLYEQYQSTPVVL